MVNPVELSSSEQQTHQGEFFNAVNLVVAAVVACVFACIRFNVWLIAATSKAKTMPVVAERHAVGNRRSVLSCAGFGTVCGDMLRVVFECRCHGELQEVSEQVNSG